MSMAFKVGKEKSIKIYKTIINRLHFSNYF